MQNNEYNELIELYEKYGFLGAKLLRRFEEIDEKKYEAWAEDFMREIEQEKRTIITEKEVRQTQNFKFLAEVPRTNKKRVVNVPKGYSKGEPKGSDTDGPMDEEVRSSFYNPATRTTTLVFSNGREENWASESIEDLRETYRSLTSDYDLFVTESEYPRDVRKAIQNCLKSSRIRLDALDKIHGVWDKTNSQTIGPQRTQGLRGVRGSLPEHDNPWPNRTSLIYFPQLHTPVARGNSLDDVIDELVEPGTAEEIMALDSVTFRLWMEEASADELEEFARWDFGSRPCAQKKKLELLKLLIQIYNTLKPQSQYTLSDLP